MEVAGKRTTPHWGKIVAAAIVLIAVAILAYSINQAQIYPSTDDATIDAEVVHVAPAVGGRLLKLHVAENAAVHKGDILFELDPYPFQATLAQAEADLALARASLATQGRAVSTQASGATVATDQVGRAAANQALAARTVARLRPLTEMGYVPRQQLDQAEVALRDANTSLAQARVQQSAARTAIDTVAGATAAVQAREAALTLAKRGLQDATVRATQDGRVVGLTILPGEMVLPSQSLFTLVASDEWHANGNFREGVLKHIKLGDCATVYSLIDRSHAMKGVVDGIGSGVLDTDKINVPRSLPYVEKSINWVRVAQRFPVRVRLIAPPAQLVRLGASAVIEIGHGAACR